MIQFNLLPDVKIAYIKAQRTKHLVTLCAVLVTAVSTVVLVILLLLVNGLQKKHLGDLSADIKEKSSELKSIEGIDKILTVQNQLLSLGQAHDKKPVTSRLPQYLEKVTPADVSISSVEFDYTATTMSLSGKGSQLTLVNKFVDTLKFTNYSIKGTDGDKKAFSEVVLSGFARADSGTTFTIDLKFDAEIFNSKNDVVLTVPAITTNRSATEKPSALFQKSPKPETGNDTESPQEEE